MGLTYNLGRVSPSVFTDSSLNVGIGAAPSGTYKLEVTGTAKVSGILTLSSTISNGTYTYTLPSATGTLALTSSLSSYLPLSAGTGNKITGDLYINKVNSSLVFQGNTTDALIYNNGSNLSLVDNATGLKGLILNVSTGSATFSSTVSINGTAVATSGILTVKTSSATLGATADLGLLISNDGTVGKMSQIGFGYSEDKAGAVIGGIITNGGGSTSSALFFATRDTTVGTTAPTERMRITSGGIVDIAGPLVIRGVLPADQTDAAVIDHNSNTMRIFSYGASGVTGDFQFRTAAGGAGSNLVSTINGTTGAYVAVSNINRKKDFEESTIGLNEILSLKPTLYRMKDDNELANKELGFIAQEVKEFIPYAYVETGEDDNKFIGLNYNPIVAALVKAIQEQNQMITSLQDRLDKAGL